MPIHLIKCILILNLFLFLISLSSCSGVRQIRPLEKGQSSISVSLGGPLTNVGGSDEVYIPLPLLSIGYNRGLITQKLDLETGFHLTQILYGVFTIDGGINYRPWLSKRWRPGLILSPKLFFMTNFKPSSLRLYPSISLTGFWNIKDLWYIYTGIENWFEFAKIRDDGNEQEHHWLIIPYIGFDVGKKKWQFQFETKVYQPQKKNTGRPTENIGFGEYGIIGFFLGVKYTFGKD